MAQRCEDVSAWSRAFMSAAGPHSTTRLVLCGHTAADLDDACALWRDPEVVRFIGGKPLSREEVWLRLLRHVGHWTVSGFGFWLARERTTGRAVGELGLADFQRDLDVPFSLGAEAGWVLAPWAHGHGFAQLFDRAVQNSLALLIALLVTAAP